MSNTVARSRMHLITTARVGHFLTITNNVLALLLIVAIVSLSLFSKPVFAENNVNAVRVWSSPDYTRFTLESNALIKYTISMLDNPGRVVIDLEDVTFSSALESLPKKIQANDPLIQTARIGRFKPQVLRLVLDLKTGVVPQAFILEPMDNFGYRLVIDIYSADKAAQMNSLDTLVATLMQPAQSQLISDKASNQSNTHFPVPKSKPTNKPVSSRIIIIAIDAGHGGKDPGAMGHNGAAEKDITLAISKKLKARIDKEPNMRAVLTREGDYYVSLEDRRAKARRLNADLFVSVHADAAHRKSAHGSSVYTLSEHGATSTAASWLAKQENSVDNSLMGGVDIDSKSHDVREMLIDLSMNATIIDSIKLGQHILAEIGDFNHLHKKHVEQAPFAVLKSPDIPSILVETAFLSNPSDEKKLVTKVYQHKMADALFSGIKRYFASSPALSRTTMAQAE